MELTTKNALTMCILASLAGIALITALDYGDNTPTAEIEKIDSKWSGENVIVCGIVKSKSVSQSGTTYVILGDKILEAQTIPLVFFKNEAHETENTLRGSSICARGTVQIYNGSVEIIARKTLPSLS